FGVADKFGNAVNAKASKCNTADHRQRGTQRGQNAATSHSSTSSSRTSSCCSTSSRRSTCTSRSAADTQNTAQTRNHARSRAQGLQRSPQCLQGVNQIDHCVNHADSSCDTITIPRDVRAKIRNRLVANHITELGRGRAQSVDYSTKVIGGSEGILGSCLELHLRIFGIVQRGGGLVDLILQVLIGADLLQKGFLERKSLVAGLAIFGNDLVVSVTGSVHSLLLQFLLRREAFQLLLQLLALGDGIAH